MKIGYIRLNKDYNRTKAKAAFIAFFCFTALLPLRLLFKPNDHDGYVEIMEGVNSGTANSDMVGKAWVALFYLKVSSIIPYEIATNILFFLYLYIVALHAKNYTTIVFHLVLIAPLSAYFGYITKEALLLFILLTTYLISRIKSEYTLITFFILMGVFSILIRQYYLPLLLLALFIPRLKESLAYIIGFILLMTLLLFGQDVFDLIYQVKKEMWFRLKYYSSVNTLFDLGFEEHGNFWLVSKVWFNNILSIFTTFFTHFGLVGIASLINLITIFFTFKITKEDAIVEIWLFGAFSLLFISYLVPDSGTFVRHSTMLSLVAIFSVILNNKKITK
ncbi:hypothetical protein D210916BOD24_19190 [Alteromonas sp. D210916BOD_24]|uniref:hypothetical protein n=1 Tax=Alteromonas sp. D210916BOD_24 TaxID=3157618 RepID=UPI00399D226C